MIVDIVWLSMLYGKQSKAEVGNDGGKDGDK